MCLDVAATTTTTAAVIALPPIQMHDRRFNVVNDNTNVAVNAKVHAERCQFS